MKKPSKKGLEPMLNFNPSCIRYSDILVGGKKKTNETPGKLQTTTKLVKD